MNIPEHLTLFDPAIHSKKAERSAYYQRNKERILAASKRYQETHKEQCKAYQRRYYQEHLKAKRQGTRHVNSNTKNITSSAITYQENYIVSFE